MTASIAWFDIPERDAALATRFYEAALRAHVSADLSVRLTRCVFRPTSPTPDFALRWRRRAAPSHVQVAA